MIFSLSEVLQWRAVISHYCPWLNFIADWEEIFDLRDQQIDLFNRVNFLYFGGQLINFQMKHQLHAKFKRQLYSEKRVDIYLMGTSEIEQNKFLLVQIFSVYFRNLITLLRYVQYVSI